MADTPVKTGDYQILDSIKIDYITEWGDFDGSSVINPQEYEDAQVIPVQNQGELETLPNAGNWFNLSQDDQNSTDTTNFWSVNHDVVFYLVQAGKTNGVVWTFMVAPQQISISKNMDINVENNWASPDRTITYAGTSMRRISLGEILIEGLSTKANVNVRINQLERLLDPVQFQKHIAPMVFELIVKPKNGVSQESRSFGFFLVTDLQLQEVMRDRKGYPIRTVANMELQEIPKYQIDNGRDLTLPDNLIVKIDKTAKEELDDEKDKKPDGSTDDDEKEGTTTKDVSYTDKDGKTKTGKYITKTWVDEDGSVKTSKWIEDRSGNRISATTVDNIRSTKKTKVSKTQSNSDNLTNTKKNTSVTKAPKEK